MLNRRIAATLLTALLVCPVFLAAQDPEAAAPETEEQKTLYALGMLISRNLGGLDLSAEEVAAVQAGMRDSLLGRDTHGIAPEGYQQQIQAFAEGRAARKAEEEKAAGREFLATETAKPGAETTDSGLIYTVLVEGSGASPQPTDRVMVHYHGTLRDGTVFDSSLDRGEPVTFGLNQVIACWTEGVAKMKVGGKARLVCPPDIAYGDAGRPGIPPGATLAFEVELLEIVAQ